MGGLDGCRLYLLLLLLFVCGRKGRNAGRVLSKSFFLRLCKREVCFCFGFHSSLCGGTKKTEINGIFIVN